MYGTGVPSALYFPYSRCLDEVALKQAVLLYDDLVFVDPVPRHERDLLYTREGIHDKDIDPKLAQDWMRAESMYRTLEAERLVRLIDPSRELSDADDGDVDELLAFWLGVDLDLNGGRYLFRGHRPWSLLEQRLPPSAMEGPLSPWLRSPRRAPWTRDNVLKVSFAVGSSISLTYALAIAELSGAVPMTESAKHHEMLRRRMASAAGVQSPGLRAADSSPHARRLIELRVIEELAPSEVLRKMSLDDLLEYRRDSADGRAQLTALMDELALEATSRPWEPAFEAELADIARRARKVAEEPALWGSVRVAARRSWLEGMAAGAALLTAALFPEVALGAGVVLGASATPRLKDFFEARRAPSNRGERNAMSYLLNAHRR